MEGWLSFAVKQQQIEVQAVVQQADQKSQSHKILNNW